MCTSHPRSGGWTGPTPSSHNWSFCTLFPHPVPHQAPFLSLGLCRPVDEVLSLSSYPNHSVDSGTPLPSSFLEYVLSLEPVSHLKLPDPNLILVPGGDRPFSTGGTGTSKPVGQVQTPRCESSEFTVLLIVQQASHPNRRFSRRKISDVESLHSELEKRVP